MATIERSGDSPQMPSLTVTLTATGGAKLAAATAKPAGLKIAIVINGTLISVPELRSPLSTSFQVTGEEIVKNREQIFAALTED